jgi:cytochrome b561
MSIKNNEQAYGCIAKFFHWSMAISIIVVTIFGFSLIFIKDAALYKWLTIFNQSLATCLFPLIATRLIWKCCNRAPKLPGSISPAQAGFARLMHRLFYAVIIIVLISGYLMIDTGYPFFWTFYIPALPMSDVAEHLWGQVHAVGSYLLTFMVLGHIGMVLKHQFISRNNIFSLMWGKANNG